MFGLKLAEIGRKVSLFLHGTTEEKLQDEYLWSSKDYTALLGKQIDAILKLIHDEVAYTRKFGHQIPLELVFKEKAFFLAIFQRLGGILSLPERMSFESARDFIFEGIQLSFHEENLKFFQESTGKGSRNWYLVHLQTTASNLLNLIWSNKLTELT